MSVMVTKVSNWNRLRASVDFTDARNGGQSNCIGVVDQRAQNSRLTAPGHALRSALGQCHFGALVAKTGCT